MFYTLINVPTAKNRQLIFLFTFSVDEKAGPVSRCKHGAVLQGVHVYLLGGRNGNLALKDFWRYHIGKSKDDIKLESKRIEYILERNLENFENFFSPFQPERELKVYKLCKCSQFICSRVH